MDRFTLEAVNHFSKLSGVMTQERRESLPQKSFAIPAPKAKKIGVAGEIKGEAKGKYPIPDEKHARNALARVSQHGTPAERQAVRSKVYSKYPGLKEGFEEAHGESPTAKGNIMKKEQGGIGKQAEASFLNELVKIAAHDQFFQDAIIGSALFDELAKVAMADPELFELWKEAGLFSRAGGAMQRLTDKLKLRVGDIMTGHGGHAIHHGAQELMATSSPLKGALAAGLTAAPHYAPHAAAAVGRGAKGAVSKLRQGLEGMREQILPSPMSPRWQPAYA